MTMGVLQRVDKPKTRKGKRELIKREPKLVENPKRVIFLRGGKCSDVALKCLKDIQKLKSPNAIFLNRKQEIRPFESVNELEKVCRKYDASLFAFGSHNKKRPNNVILGRLFDNQMLDVFEFGVENLKSLQDFKNTKFTQGNKPCLIFTGEPFQLQSSDHYRLKNFLIDFFHGEEVVNVRVEGIEHVLSFTSFNDKIYMRNYKIIMKKSGEKTPLVELEEIGPSCNLTLRRNKLASADLFKSACRQPKELKVKVVKNISRDSFGSQLGRVHIPRQNLQKLSLKNMKGLKKTKVEAKVARAKKVEKQQRQQKDSNSPKAQPQPQTPKQNKSDNNMMIHLTS